MAKLFDQPQSQWSWLSSADRPSIELNRWDDFGGSSSQKTFVCRKDIIPRQIAFPDRHLILRCKFENDLARNPFKRTRVHWWSPDVTAFYDKEVVARTLGDIALLVQHYPFRGPCVFGLDL